MDIHCALAILVWGGWGGGGHILDHYHTTNFCLATCYHTEHNLMHAQQTTPTHRVHMDVVIVVGVIDGLEESFQLTDSSPVDREQEHHPGRWPLTTKGDKPSRLSWIWPKGACVLYLSVIQSAGHVEACHVMQEVLAFLGLCS